MTNTTPTICKSGLTGWKCRLKDNYTDRADFDAWNEIYSLAERLGYDSGAELWEENPMIEGSTNPEDLRVCDEQEDKEPITPVVFRVWKGEDFRGTVTALFPADCAEYEGRLCSCYTHIGQHGGADYSHMITKTRPATPDEYASLKAELESEPYNYRLKVYQRATPQHREQFNAELKRINGR